MTAIVTAMVTTVVTCMTDSERPFLEEALRSVLDQDVETEVLLCVADDNEWCEPDLGALVRDVRLLRLPLAPPGLVRNAAIARVHTEFVAFLDGDDVWQPGKVRRQLECLRSGDFDVVASRHVLIREDGKPYFYGFARSVPMQSSWIGRTTAFRDRPYTDHMVGEDVEVWRQVEDQLRWKVLDQYLLRYRVRETSQSSLTWSKKRKLDYARRSRTPGVRPLLLAASGAVGLALRARDRLTALRSVRRSSGDPGSGRDE